jgi:putative membrane protein
MHSGEIALAQLAKEKSSSDDIREYADVVITTHTDALKKLSDRTGENRTRDNTNPSSDTKNHMAYLKPLSGDQFDREFVVLMIADNQDAANTLKQPFVTVQNSELRNYMNDVVPSLESNVNKAKKLQK